MMTEPVYLYKEWTSHSIDEIAEIVRGVSWSSEEECSDKSLNTIRVYKIPHVQAFSKFQLETNPVYITFQEKHRKSLLKNNDILMVSSNGNPKRVGNVVLYNEIEDALPASFLIRIRAKKCDNIFLYYLLSSEYVQSILTNNTSGSTGLRNININMLREAKVKIPPLQEQKKIAEILSTIDEEISIINQKIIKTKELKKGLMQKLFTKGIDHTGYKQSVLGEIPLKWEVAPIDKVTQRKSGHTPNKKIESYWNGSIPWISLKDTYRLDNGYIYETTDYTTVEGINNSSAVLLPSGTVVVSRDATVGKIGITGKEMATSQHFINYICSIELNNKFLYYYFLYKKNMFERVATGSTIKTIGLGFFKELKIVLPPLPEQQKIAEILSSVDEQIDSYEQEKEKYIELKKGLMQQLLTGKLRVTV